MALLRHLRGKQALLASGEPHRTIQDSRGLIRKNYFNDVMNTVMGDFNTMLSFLD